ncbi:MAG: hypothetical protein ABH845_04375 [Candidatus Omnitrophota bacterium]
MRYRPGVMNAHRPFKKTFILLLVSLVVFESSCAHVARVKFPPPPFKTPPELIRYYNYSPYPGKPLIYPFHVQERYIEKRVIFRKVEDTTGNRSSLVIHYYEPKTNKKHPLILITPILGKNYGIERSFASFFAKRGFACAIVYRKPLRFIPDEPLSVVEAYLRSSIIRLRIALDWLCRQEKVDPNAIGTFGISFGGMLNTVLAAVDSRPKCHLIALAGGELAEVICYSHEKTIERYRNQFMKLSQLTPEEFREKLREAIISEPVTFARYIDTRKVYLFIAMFDLVIGKKHSRKLAKALGNPETYYVPLGHYTSVLAIPFVRVKAANYFESHLKQDVYENTRHRVKD